METKLIEVIKSNGKRVIVKHKGESFSETKTKREVNPRNVPMMCGHILAALKTLSRVPLKEGKIPFKIEVELSIPEAKKRRA